MHLEFFRVGFLVKPGSLIPFLVWFLKPVQGLIGKARKLGSVILFTRISGERRESLPDVDFSWIRYGVDGNRIQAFDVENKRVIQIPLKLNQEQVKKEVEARRLLGSSTPEILEYDYEKGLIVEEMLDLEAAPVSISVAHDAFTILENDFYQVSSVRAEEYIRSFSFVEDPGSLQSIVDNAGLEELKISRVHGDIWPGNLFHDEHGKLILLDWEYTSNCIVSYDVWTYLFQLFKSPFGNEYFSKLSESLAFVYKREICPQKAEAFHLLHLLERFRLYLQLDRTDKKEELEYMQTEMNRITGL